MCKLVSLRLMLVITLLSATSPLIQPVPCPLQCDCHLQQDRHVIDCSHKNLTSLPFLCNFENDGSGKKVEFYANGNKLRYVLKSAFYHVRNRLSHLEITSNPFNIELAPSAFNSFAESLETLKLEPVYENLNTMINLLKNVNKLKIVQLTSVTNSRFQILSSKFSLPNLVELSLQRCQIRNISSGVFQDVNGLRILNLSFNHLTGFPQELVEVVSKSVSILRLSNNEISEINYRDIGKGCKLTVLDLSFNPISFIEDGVLEKCARLRLLNLSHSSNLFSLGRFAFDGLFGLNLDVSHSPVSSLDFVKPGTLALLSAFGTELECNCDELIEYMEALYGNLKGTCRLELKDVGIQSKVLDCVQNEQRRKRTRLNDWSRREENGFDVDTRIDADPNKADDCSGINKQTELKPSTGHYYFENSRETNRRGCQKKPCPNIESLDESIVEPKSVVDLSKAQETRVELIEISANLLRLGPSKSSDSFLDISSATVYSESITPSPIMLEPIRPEPSSSFQASTTEDFELEAPLHFPEDDTLVVNAEDEPDAKMTKISNTQHQTASRDVVDTTIGMPFKAVFLSTSMLDISTMTPEPTSTFTTDTSSADIFSDTIEKPPDESKPQSFEANEIKDSLSMRKSGKNIFSNTDASCSQQTAQTTLATMPTPASCGDRDRTIQPSTTINIINSISSTITYKREYTYYIKTVNHLNPQFLPPTKTRENGHEESVKEPQSSQTDAPSFLNAEGEMGSENDVKVVLKESDQQSQLEAEGMLKEGIRDEHVDKARGYLFQGPLYLLACLVHACLLFAAFLMREPGLKIKR